MKKRGFIIGIGIGILLMAIFVMVGGNIWGDKGGKEAAACGYVFSAAVLPVDKLPTI